MTVSPTATGEADIPFGSHCTGFSRATAGWVEFTTGGAAATQVQEAAGAEAAGASRPTIWLKWANGVKKGQFIADAECPPGFEVELAASEVDNNLVRFTIITGAGTTRKFSDPEKGPPPATEDAGEDSTPRGAAFLALEQRTQSEVSRSGWVSHGLQLQSLWIIHIAAMSY